LSPGEDYLATAVKEMTEELVSEFTAKVFMPYKVLRSDKPTHKEFQQIFALKLDRDIRDLRFEEEEIGQLAWRDIDELREILVINKNAQWVLKPWDEEVLNWIFASLKRGSYRSELTNE